MTEGEGVFSLLSSLTHLCLPDPPHPCRGGGVDSSEPQLLGDRVTVLQGRSPYSLSLPLSATAMWWADVGSTHLTFPTLSKKLLSKLGQRLQAWPYAPLPFLNVLPSCGQTNVNQSQLTKEQRRRTHLSFEPKLEISRKGIVRVWERTICTERPRAEGKRNLWT